MTKTLTKKQIAFRIIESYIAEMVDCVEYGESASTPVDNYDGAVNMAMQLGIITVGERKAFDRKVNEIVYG